MKTGIINFAIFMLSMIVGMIVNFTIIIIGSKIISVPNGINVVDANSLKENIHLFKVYHFIFPFLAHAGGTFIGAILVSKFAKSFQFVFAMGIGLFFLFGGIMNIKMIPGPLWFNILDVTMAYIPMAWLGWKMGAKD
jgi:hypothetical protein